jgi:hypothetical protein
VFAAVLLLLLACWVWANLRPGPPSAKLSVVFIGMTNNPARQMTPTRIELCQGATGPCAMFLVKNITSHEYIWFQTASVEQKASAGWQRFVLTNSSWSGVGGSLWQPGYGCLFGVGWPPGLPTNAVWRLRLTCGRDPSELGIIINQKLGRTVFHSGKEEAGVLSSEVKE